MNGYNLIANNQRESIDDAGISSYQCNRSSVAERIYRDVNARVRTRQI